MHTALPTELCDKVELVVTSPMRRTMETTLLGLTPLLKRTGRKNVVLLPHAQECSISKHCLDLREDISDKLTLLHALQTHAMLAVP